MRLLATKSLNFVRTSWMIVGIALALFGLAESCYRAQDRVRSVVANRAAASGSTLPATTPGPAPRHPVASEPWYPEFAREFEESSPQAWRSFVYFRRARAYTGTYEIGRAHV